MVGDDFLLPILHLGQHSTHSSVACVSARITDSLGVGKASADVVVNAASMLLKASSQSLDHVNSLPSSVSLWSDLVI